jgi:hypothetical protein
MNANKDITYGEIFSLFHEEFPWFAECHRDYRPYGPYRLWVWLKGKNGSLIVNYDTASGKCSIRRPADGEKWSVEKA